MRLFLLILCTLWSGVAYTQTFRMQYNKVSSTEIQFTTVYQGPQAEIILPSRGRIVALAEQTDLNAGGGRIRVGIRVGEEEAPSDQEYTVRFTYSLLVPNTGGFGSVSKNWYPTIKNSEAEYHLTALSEPLGFVIFPYQQFENSTFSFMSDQSPKFALFNHTTVLNTAGEVPVSIFHSTGFNASPEDIIKIMDYVRNYFGNKDIQEIVVINTMLVQESSFIDDNKLYLFIPGVGTTRQIQDTMLIAWGSTFEQISNRLWKMFQDTVLRLAPLDTPADTSTVADTTDTTADTPPTVAETSTTETDLGKFVLVPPADYYQSLFEKGFETGEVQKVDVAGIFDNFALLHMAQYNIGADNLLAGIKAYFNDPSANPTGEAPITTEEVPEETATEETPTEEVSEETTTEDTPPTTEEKIEETPKDTELIDWGIITQNQLQEPLLSLYTKDVLIDKGILPHLVAKSNIVTRNSDNIPNFSFSDSNGETVEINWNGFRSININVTANGNYTLDPERNVPQQVFLDSYYTFDQAEQQFRANLINRSTRQKAPGEVAFRKHLDVVSFTVENTNNFGTAIGDTVYVVITHILSNTTGALKPAIKEVFYSVNPDGNITYLNTRLRV